jgi:hypothetical protein
LAADLYLSRLPVLSLLHLNTTAAVWLFGDHSSDLKAGYSELRDFSMAIGGFSVCTLA